MRNLTLRRGLMASAAAFSLLIMAGVAVAATSGYVAPTCTVQTLSCQGKHIAALESWAKAQSAAPTVTATVTATVTPTPSSTPTSPSPSPTPTTTQPAGQCSPVVYSSSDPQAAWNNDANGTWWVGNDAWNGSRGPQTINVCSATQWYAVSNQTDNQGQVETYPDTEYDVGGRDTPSTKTIAQYQSITSTFDESFPTNNSTDAAYDLWLNNWGTEIMVWNEVHGSNTYWLTCTGCGNTDVTIAGVNYRLINYGDEFAFINKTMTKSGSVDLLAVMQYLVSVGLVKGTDVPTQLEYGVEISATTGTQTFPLNNVTFSLS